MINFPKRSDGTCNATSTSALLEKEKASSILWDSNGITLTRIVSGTKTGVSSDLIEARRLVAAGVGSTLIHLQVTVPALVPRDTEAAVAVPCVQAHGPVVARAGSTLVLVQLTGPSSVPGRAEAPGAHRVLPAAPPVLAGAGATGSDGGFTGRPSVSGRTFTHEAPPSRGVHASGISLAGVGEAQICHVVTVFV